MATVLAATVGVLLIAVPPAQGEETSEELRQGLIEIAEVADLLGGGDGGHAAAARAALEELQPESLEAIQAELAKQPGWQGTDAVLESLLPLATSRAAVPGDLCSLEPSCPDTAPKCELAKKVSVSAHLGLFLTVMSLEFPAIALEAACGAVGAFAEDAASFICIAAAAVRLVQLPFAATAEVSDICGGGEVEADVQTNIVAELGVTGARLEMLGEQLGAIGLIEERRFEAALATCTKVATLMLPAGQLTTASAAECPDAECDAGACTNEPVVGAPCGEAADCCRTSRDLEGIFVRAQDLTTELFGGALRAGTITGNDVQMVRRTLDTAQTKFVQKRYGEAFGALCAAYRELVS